MRWMTIGLFALLLGCIDRQIDDGEAQASETGDGDGVDELQLIVDGAAAYFQIEHPPGEFDPLETPLHRCPHPGGQPGGGEATITPDIGMDCYLGPDHKCVPAQGGGGAGFYDIALWLDNSVWSGIADLDHDAIFSTYERRGSADEQGIHIDPMLYIWLPIE
jgi:hypothetical protein